MLFLPGIDVVEESGVAAQSVDGIAGGSPRGKGQRAGTDAPVGARHGQESVHETGEGTTAQGATPVHTTAPEHGLIRSVIKGIAK